MAFERIDMVEWPRRELYRYYSEQICTSYEMNVELDVTKLRNRCLKKGIHFYPETQSADNIKNTRIIDGIKRYRDQDKMFYYRKNGQEIECYFSVYDDDMERMGYCVAIFDMGASCEISIADFP